MRRRFSQVDPGHGCPVAQEWPIERFAVEGHQDLAGDVVDAGLELLDPLLKSITTDMPIRMALARKRKLLRS